ncbi:ABC transporter substrate-binding protein [Nocardioides cavernaquae]|uniref:Iron transporter n=1 Tax=Nocardioides cavernaquae TaxID=2321396 RepID=A0A3A5H7M6_9ACTN|nr:ABC transporter substrate-binding protein [Nocardioides cavernaquae]RJS45868.1 iron transporter [Nocardioides cavernaquae]
MKTRNKYGVLAAAAVLGLSGCGGATKAAPAAGGTVTVTNCGTKVDFPAPAKKLFVNDSNLISMVLALGAEKQVGAVSSIGRDELVLTEHYGAAVAGLNQVSDDYPGLETVIAAKPDVMVAGWNYGYDETKQLTPDALAERGIAAYILTESCRQEGSSARGIVDPWTALRDDMTNLGEITGRTEAAAAVVADFDQRLAALDEAPKADERPVLFVFDSGDKAVFTSGAFGAPQAVIEAGGGHNAMADLKDTWTEVSWERLAASKPDAFVFVDYPGQSFEQKVAVLRANPATRNLPAVREGRFLNLPYAMWTSGPLNIDAAEEVRTALEKWGLVPKG